MPNRIRSRFAVALSAFAIVAATLVPAFPAAAEDPPAPDPIVTSEPSESPEPEATPTSEPAPEATPSAEPTPVESPSAEPTATPTPTPEPTTLAASTVQYSGTAQQLSSDGLAVDEDTVLFGVTAQGYLNVDVSGLATRPDVTSPVTLTLKVPAGLTLSADPDTRFTQLANAGASSPLVATASSKVKQTEPRETAALVNTTPNVPSVHHVFAVYVSPTDKKVKDAAQGNNTAANAMVTAADTYWGLQSGGTIDFVLDGVVPWYQSTYSCKTSAGSTALWNQAMVKAKAAGFVPGKNMHLLLLMPEGGPTYAYCGGAIGLGSVGGSVNQGGVTWVMGTTSDLAKATISHEFGHNMSLGHADVLACLSPTPIFDSSTLNYPSGTTRGSIDGCTIEDYEDITDVMGYGLGAPYGTGGALSSPQAIRAGIWTSSAYSIAPVAVDTPYTLQPVSGHSGVRAVVVQDNDGQSYFVEYRNGTNEDSPPKTAGCDTSACVLPSPNVRILRFEPQGYQGYPGYDSLVIGRSNTNIGFTGAGTFWSGGSVNQGVKIEIVSVGASTASIKVTRTAHATTDDWVVVKTTIAYDSSLRVGDTLTAFLGDYWDAGSYTFSWTRDGVAIPSSNAQNYTLTKDDLGKHIDVLVTSNPLPACACSISGFYGPSPAVLAGIYQPTDPGPVTINDSTTPLQAETPVGGAGNWPTGTTFTYQWYKGTTASTVTTAIVGQTTAQYVPAAGNTFLRVRVTASVPGYSPVVRYSAAHDYAIKNTVVPVFTGIPKVGTQLDATVGWPPTFTDADGNALAGVTSSYQWLRNGVPITDTPAATLDATDDGFYTLRSLDYNAKVTLRIISERPGFAPNTVTSAPLTINQLGVIQATSPEASITNTYDVTSTTGVKLTASTSGVTETELGTPTYQWYRVNLTTSAATLIAGATTSIYKPVAADYPYKIRVVVTVKKLGYTNLPLSFTRDFSLRLGVFPLAITGTPQVDHSISVDTVAPEFHAEIAPGVFNTVHLNSPGVVPTYQWRRAGVNVAGQTADTFNLTYLDLGKIMSYSLKVSYNGYIAYTGVSPNTPAVIPATFAAGGTSPEITGPDFASWLLLTSSLNDVTPPATSATIQWYRDGVAVPTKTNQNYVLSSADFDKVISVKVTYKRAGYSNEVLTASYAPGTANISVGTLTPGIMTGEPVIDQSGSNTLHATPGTYESRIDGTPLPTGPGSPQIQWLVNGIPNGQTGTTYDPVAADRGKVISVRFTMIGVDGSGNPLLQNLQVTPATQPLGIKTMAGAYPQVQPTVVIETPSTFVTVLSAVGISGITEPGKVEAFQWMRNGVAITGATKSKYTLTAADRGKNITVRITTTKAPIGADSWTKVVQVSTPVDRTLVSGGGVNVFPQTTFQVGGELGVGVPAFTDSLGSSVTGVTQTHQWYRTLLVKVNGVYKNVTTAIPASQGGTLSYYFLKAADLGATIKVTVTTGKLGYIPHIATYTTSPATDKVLKGTLVNTATAPVVTVSNPATNTLLATPPLVTGAPQFPTSATQNATFTYKWLRDGVAIPLATASTYKLVAADTGKDISVRVTANLAGYNSAVLPDSTPLDYSISLDPIDQPYISSSNWTVGGTAYVYNYVTYVTKDGALPSPVVTFQWLRSGVVIPGATGYYYPLQAADYGKFVTARLTISKPGYLPLVTTLPNAQYVDKGITLYPPDVPNAPNVTVVPGAGTGTLLAQVNDLNPATPVPTYAYKWYRDNPGDPAPAAVIAGATAATYALTAADYLREISVQVTMTRPNFVQVTTVLPTTPEVDYSIVVSDKATIAGVEQVTQVLTATPPTFYEPDGTTVLAGSPTLSYAWYRSGVVIPGATADNYTLVAADLGKLITVKVTAKMAGRLAATSPASDPTIAILPGSLGGGAALNIAMTDVAARKLTASVSGLTQTGVTTTYQWYRKDATPGSHPWVAISGATAATYTLTAADYRHFVSLQVNVAKTGFVTFHPAIPTGTEWTLLPNGSPSIDDPAPLVGDVLNAIPTAQYYDQATGGFATPDSFTYRWYRDGVAISGATNAAYTVVAADRGMLLSVKLTPVKAGRLTVTETAIAGVKVPLEFAGTKVKPNVTKGSSSTMLTAAMASGSVTTTGVSLSYQWFQGVTPIVSATTSTYFPIQGDWNQPISVQITVSKPGYTTLVLPMSTGFNASLVGNGLPVISDTSPQVGDTLTVTDTTYKTLGLVGSAGTPFVPAFGSQDIIWYADGVQVNAGPSYLVDGADVGKVITVMIHTPKVGWIEAFLTSDPTAAVT